MRSATACRQLPVSAIGRLGPGQARRTFWSAFALCDLDKTPTNQAANALRHRICCALHSYQVEKPAFATTPAWSDG